MDRGVWWALFSPQGCKESDTTEHVHTRTHTVKLGAVTFTSNLSVGSLH